MLLASRSEQYIVKRHPKTRLWHVLGLVSTTHYMQVSDGFKTKAQATKWKVSQLRADREAKGLLGAV